MKALTVALLASVLALFACRGQEAQSYSRDYADALRRGASAKLTLSVVDEDGRPVSGAMCTVGFNDVAVVIDEARGLTDTNGCFTAQGRAKWFIGGTVAHGTHYTTAFSFLDGGRPGRVRAGRWLPWNPTIPLVLKSLRNPVRMMHSREDVLIPRWDQPLGFDLVKGDWVAPHGNGVVADMVIRLDHIDEALPFRKLVAEFPGDMNGAYLRKKDAYSVFKSDYHALTNGQYEARIKNRDGARGPANVLLGSEDYLVFRVRSVCDVNGALVSALYGKIYGPCDYFVMARNKLRLVYFLNPVANDTNLEFDGKGWGDGSIWGR